MRANATLYHVFYHTYSLDLDLTQWYALFEPISQIPYFPVCRAQMFYSSWPDHDKNATAVSDLERFCDRPQMTIASGPKPVVGNSPSAPQVLETSLQEMATPMKSVEDEDNFDGFADTSLYIKSFV